MSTVCLAIIGDTIHPPTMARAQQISQDAPETAVWLGPYGGTAGRTHALGHWRDERTEDYLLMLDSQTVPPRSVLAMIDRDRPLVSANVPWFRPIRSAPIPVPYAFTLREIGEYQTLANPFGRTGCEPVDLVSPYCLLIRRDAIPATLEQPFVPAWTRLDARNEYVDSVPLCVAVPPHYDHDQVCDRQQLVSLRALHEGYMAVFLSIDAGRRPASPASDVQIVPQ